jgi:glycogen phosphorylase
LSIQSEANSSQAANPPQEHFTQQFHQAYARTIAQRSDANSPAAHEFAFASACRELLADRWVKTQQQDAKRTDARRVHYLSMEFLMGRALQNALAALAIEKLPAAENTSTPPSLAQIFTCEPDAALGNGGLGRLAACFLDAFATLGLPSFGYGIRYEFGMFAQSIQAGRQIEVPDEWLGEGNPWEILRHELHYKIGFGGSIQNVGGSKRWKPAETITAQAYDFIVPGHNTERVSTLRQWHAHASQPIDFATFCRGEYQASGAHRQSADTLNWVLYPDDSTHQGRELRLKQEYLLVSASLQDMLARHLREFGDIDSFGKLNAVHLNDTHPALAPVELMRLLMDEHGLHWNSAWKITTQATSYTNHTLMPEALETWPVPMMQALLPRHLEIIYDMNQFFLEQAAKQFTGDDAMMSRLSLIDERGERRVRMAHIAIVASHKINGVSALHSQLMVETIFADFAKIWPEKFINVTNGVTPRRWLQQANPELSALLDRRIGKQWRADLNQLSALIPLANDATLGQELLAAKRKNKMKLAEHIRRELGISINVDSLFDVQIKRIHEYKRQLLNVLHVVARYQAILANPTADWTPRTVIFAGKAASAYHNAKLIIQLMHDVGRAINSDPRVGDKLKLVFLPNYSVTLAELIIPAADLSEQISTAGTEASGTGNMKFGLNGALTIGTWDGANIEMAQAMGEDNMFVFGLRADAVEKIKSLGYDSKLFVEQNAQLKNVIDAIGSGEFSYGEPTRYRGLMDNLLGRDQYMLLADFADYVETQSRVDALFKTPQAWTEHVARNIAGMGEFSVDHTIRQYVDKVWQNNK